MSVEPAKIRVAIRVRPLLENEIKSGLQNTRIECHEDKGEVSLKPDERQQYKSFKFDHVFSDQASQQQLYSVCEIDFLVQKVIEGYHATIFAYGQTGSGKTYTMEGMEAQNGLIPRAVSSLFNKIKANSTQHQFSVYCSFLQIYNEKIYDLLVQGGPQGSGLKLRWNMRDQFTVENLYIYECKTFEDVLQLFHMGIKNRVTASHKLNLTSSRSHSILELKIEGIDNNNPDNIISSKLELVDLAGSERISLTGAEGKQAKESIDINKSLFTLRQVISTIADSISNKSAPQHIPYRDSKLTCLLKQSIGGNSYCLMIACIAPADLFYEENVSTLTYATKATFITNIPQRNDDPKNKLINELKQQIVSLKEELNKANQHIEFLTQLVQNSDNVLECINFLNSFLKKQANRKKESINHRQIQIFTLSWKSFRNYNKLQYNLSSKNEQEGNMDYDVFSDRLVDSINMVRELLLSNKEMREKEEQANQRCDQLQREIMQLQRENFELRERSNQGYPPYSDEAYQDNDSTQQNRLMNVNRPGKSNSQYQQQKKNGYLNYMDDSGFLPEQSTQFQRQVQPMNQQQSAQQTATQTSDFVTSTLNASISHNNRKPNTQQPNAQPANTQQANRSFNQGRAVSLSNRPPPIQPRPGLPSIKHQIQQSIQQSAAQQFFNDEESTSNIDEMTNFGRRTLYQNGYNQSQQKFYGDQRMNRNSQMK